MPSPLGPHRPQGAGAWGLGPHGVRSARLSRGTERDLEAIQLSHSIHRPWPGTDTQPGMLKNIPGREGLGKGCQPCELTWASRTAQLQARGAVRPSWRASLFPSPAPVHVLLSRGPLFWPLGGGEENGLDFTEGRTKGSALVCSGSHPGSPTSRPGGLAPRPRHLPSRSPENRAGHRGQRGPRRAAAAAPLLPAGK